MPHATHTPESEAELRQGAVTELLRAWSAGDRGAGASAVELLYGELRRIAAACFRGERRDHTLQATAVLHEAYLRLERDGRVEWRDRNHFLSVAARLMRRVLVDHSREWGAAKRGAGRVRAGIDAGQLALPSRPPDLVALDDALADLERVDARMAALVELRYFGGLTLDEAADVLGVSVPTVVREWRRARAWLYCRLSGAGEGDGP
jgi:RNA polymerase sigma factor (TIGR02999 family)